MLNGQSNGQSNVYPDIGFVASMLSLVHRSTNNYRGAQSRDCADHSV